MDTIATKIQQGLRRQLSNWRSSGAGGDQRLGWKIGINLPADQKRIGLPSALIGYLDRRHNPASGQTYRAPRNSKLLVEPEVAIQMDRDVPGGVTAEQAETCIGAYCAALELVDVNRRASEDVEDMLANNMIHEAVSFSDHKLAPSEYSREKLEFSLSVNGVQVRTLDQDRVPQSFGELIVTVANFLASNGERLKKGDWIITGAASKAVPVGAGDNVSLDMGTLGSLSLSIN